MESTGSRPIVAAFDFDGTLTYRDSLLPFLICSFGYIETGKGILLELPTLLGFLLSLKSRQETKERLLTRFLKGYTRETLHQMGRHFAEGSLQKLLKPKSIQKLLWHQSQGHTCILVSASIGIYLQPWAEAQGFSALLSSDLAFDASGNATGLLKGHNCWGPEKVRRLLAHIGTKDSFILYAYGDSEGDADLLRLADYPTKV